MTESEAYGVTYILTMSISISQSVPKACSFSTTQAHHQRQFGSHPPEQLPQNLLKVIYYNDKQLSHKHDTRQSVRISDQEPEQEIYAPAE